MSNNSKMLLFDNPDDFLKYMDYLQKEYNKNKENKHTKENKYNIIVSGGRSNEK